ncbi:Crp/Fnr family transcriptional regulator [Carboxydothermus pertinax]|uniref:Crp/Fnr family transcriptional regulator n=1 Tax=Carboxydothermus pertinax TaxID=870242 RepID=A0A1L8CVB6_9THEO|nr:Crp/Fnr family transcriptional regulator [Carboxydothermus pertinax]GAV22895.1 hypothetical protein cpu_14050 [Carboxydothermus pertinax]
MRSFGLITNNKLLGKLSIDQLKEFIPSFKEIYLKKKEIAFSPGIYPNDIFLVTKGRIKVFLTYPDGKEFILTILDTGDIFCGHTRAFGQALEDSVILLVPLEAFQEMLLRYPELMYGLVRVLGDALKHSLDVIERMVFMEAKIRLANLLYQWALNRGVHQDEGILVPTGLTREELAYLIGTTRQTLATLIKDFEAQKIIKVSKKSIFVKDLEALKKVIFQMSL